MTSSLGVPGGAMRHCYGGHDPAQFTNVALHEQLEFKILGYLFWNFWE